MKKWMIWILFLVLLGPSAISAAEKGVGKIAVASDIKALTGPVGFRMGQSPYYLLFDEKGKFLEAIENPFKEAGGKAAGRSGKSVLDSLRFNEKGEVTGGVDTLPRDEREKIWNSMLGFLASKGITVVVAEQFGYEIIRAMKDRGIICVEFKGQTADAAKKALQSAEK